MKQFMAAIAMLIVSFAIAQDEVEYPVDDFSELKVFDGISVKLIPGKENKVVIKGEDARSVTVRWVRGKLKIRMEIEKLFSGYATFAEVYYNKPLSVLDVNENALITSDEVIDQVDLELRAQEAGEIDLKVALKRLRVKSVTGATIAVEGSAKNQVVDVNTGGGYEAGNLETEQTEVEVNAGGYADIRASEYVDATVRAGGNINIYGKPRVIDQTKFLGGTIKEF
ncbi:head GIN domain-containing protein [Robertkochia sediminum]|uniref:head GIN domain-containing protein n=1 Tax=Robertkochia sediminum TaxID=2785326 RepID=UPI0019313030|nr:head GIN domain-containing protein [Robertkochia sediminum]MBL7471469.1 DUF2807 domain-containing protein [Robertkochia sediminum]